MIKVRPLAVTCGGGARVEITPRFLGTGLGRKVYIVEQNRSLEIPDRKVHAHGIADTLIPISGDVELAYLDSQGRKQFLKLEPGFLYEVPPYLPHQVRVIGGILESYFPTQSYVEGMQIHEREGGLFREEKGVSQHL